MDSYMAYQLLDIVSGEQSKNAKIALLEEFLEDEDFRKMCVYAYDPLITFGVLKTPDESGTRDGNFTENTWLLLDMLREREATGNMAKELIRDELARMNLESQQLFTRILNKDLRAGFGVKSINKACKNLIFVMPYMRCSLLKDVRLDNFNWEAGVYSQLKADGMFVNVRRTTGWADLISRGGQAFPQGFHEPLESTIKKKLKLEKQYHGELLVYRDGVLLSRKKGNGLLNRVLKGGALDTGVHVELRLWDVIPLEAMRTKLPYSVPYMERYKELMQLGLDDNVIQLTETKIVHSFIDAQRHAQELMMRGEEGTIFKDPMAEWRNGTSRLQVKLKAEKHCELRVLDKNPGTGKNKDLFGSLLCGTDDCMVEANVSGFTDDEREEIMKNWVEWKGSIITVKFNEVVDSETSERFSLFLPRYEEQRLDKKDTDDVDTILAQ